MVITEVPDPRDFELTGIDYINLAADPVFQLYFDIREIGFDGSGWEEEQREFWAAAQRPMASALALVEQGTQLLLKARIAAVSPFLLIAGDVRYWPRRVDEEDTPFAAFRTLDAQELIRAHNAVASERLDADFAQSFEDLRKRRNTIMHTIDRNLTVTANEIVRLCLESIHRLVGPYKWIDLRRDYLYRTPVNTATGGDWVETQVIREINDLLRFLNKKELLRYFGFDRAQRHYICPTCKMSDQTGNLNVTTAQLKPNEPDSTSVYCFLCDQDTAVARTNCDQNGCPGNVVAIDEGYCLTCGKRRSP